MLRMRKAVLALLIALIGASAFGVSHAGAITPIPGRIFGLADIGGTSGDLFRTTTTNDWRRLTTGLRFPESVSAAPNGRFAVMCATRGSGGIYRIYRVGVNGGRIRNLIGNRPGCGQTVSPDSRKVAYVSDPRRRVAKLNVVRSGGGGNRTIYRFCSSCLYNPVWAGKRIYFERAVTRNPSSDSEIYSIRARDGRGLRRHTNDRGSSIDYGLADVSRDGRNLLIFATDGFGATGLSVFSPRGAIRYDLAVATGTQSFADATFSPSGTEIAYLRKESEVDPYSLWLGPNAPMSWYSIFPMPAVSTGGLYSVDWARR